MRHVIFGLLALTVAATPARADDQTVLIGPAPDWAVVSEMRDVPDNASGLVFVRRNEILVHLDSQGMRQYSGFRMKLLHPSALQMGNLSIAWNPDAGAPILHALRVHRGDQVIDLTETAQFEVLRREENLEAAHLDGILTAVLRVPDLRVGDELEFATTTAASDPVLTRRDSGILILTQDPPAGRHVLGLSWDEGHEPTIAMSPDLQAGARQGRNFLRVQFDDPMSISPPQDAPMRYSWRRVIEFTDYPDWASVSSMFAPLYQSASQIDDRSPLRQEAARIAAEHDGDMARARAALELVQQQVRYVFVGLDGGNLMPATADETWERRYGDCKGKTTLLLALLRELGVDAYPVLVNNAGIDDGLDLRLPIPGLFDHVLVRARIDGAEYWLDGTLPPVAPPALDPVMDYEWVLPLRQDGAALEHRSWRPYQTPDEITLIEIDARSGFDEPAQVTQTTIKRGIEGLAEQVRFSPIPPARLLSAFQQNLGGSGWQTIDDVQWRFDVEAGASVLTTAGTQIMDWDTYRTSGRRMSLPGGGFRPPQRRVRQGGPDQDAPFFNEPSFRCSVTTVRLPDSTKASHWSHNSTFDTRIFGRSYYRAFELRDGEIRMIRASRTERDEIPAALAQADNARIPDFDNSMAWIYYNPLQSSGGRTSGQTVPATYEIDWTVDTDPCLPVSARY